MDAPIIQKEGGGHSTLKGLKESESGKFQVVNEMRVIGR